MNEESRSHVENDKAYEKASNCGNILGRKPEGLRKHQGATLDGEQREWPSTLDITPEGIENPEGKWEDKKQVIESLWERMEFFMLKVMKREYEVLPGTILRNILAREFEEKDGTWDKPNMAQHIEGGRWGMGDIIKERREKADITPIEVLMKLHKTPIQSRPVGRACNSQMKPCEQLVGGILTQVLEDIERERERQGKKRIVLNSTLPYARIIEDIDRTWEKEFLEGEKLDESVEILGYDVVALYPSLKLEFMIRETDRAMVLRIETMKGKEEKRKATELRNIIMPLIIFMLEHQFCSTVGKDGKITVWRQVIGISIGSSCSGILANLTLLMGEIDMLDRLEARGIVLSTYNRYVDDITAIGDVKEKNKKGELFVILEGELNNLDPIGNSIRVTGEQICADRVSKQQLSKQQLEKRQGLAYLDL